MLRWLWFTALLYTQNPVQSAAWFARLCYVTLLDCLYEFNLICAQPPYLSHLSPRWNPPYLRIGEFEIAHNHLVNQQFVHIQLQLQSQGGWTYKANNRDRKIERTCTRFIQKLGSSSVSLEWLIRLSGCEHFRRSEYKKQLKPNQNCTLCQHV